MSRTFAIATIALFVLTVVAAAVGFGPLRGQPAEVGKLAFAVGFGLTALVASLGVLTRPTGRGGHLGGGRTHR